VIPAASRVRGGLPAVAVLSAALAAGACSSSTGSQPASGTSSPAAAPAAQSAAPGARQVTLPDLSRVELTVQDQAKERYAALQELLAKPEAAAAEKGQAYGNLAMLLHAGEYYQAAEPAYLNAADLAPQDARWPYLLGHLHKSMGRPDLALADFTRALDLQPKDVPTLVWLGRLYLDQGRPEQAEPLFERARTEAPNDVAVLAGLGQAALARRDFSRAATVLEAALALPRTSSSLHSPLAMAYRGLGDVAKAEAQLKLWRNTDVLVADPVRQQLDLSLQSGLSFELRGVRALEAASAATNDAARAKSFKAAEDAFRRGIAIAPGATMLGRSLRHKLATALALQGDVRGAFRQFTEVVRLAPQEGPDETASKAHYSLGVLQASAGRRQEAVTHLTAALKFNPNYLEARQALGDALCRAGRHEAALPHYAEVVRLNPKAGDARLGYAMALVRVGRYREARDWLVEATRLLPDDARLRHALARVLAAAPDASARDGQQALALAEQLLTIVGKTTEMGETLAMAYAEVGSFSQASDIQRGVLDAASRAGFSADVRRMTANLRLYERGQACRTPWQPNETVFTPGPPISPDLAAILASSPPARSAGN
jgi:tetratricopeptide (TPR) repeat protein